MHYYFRRFPFPSWNTLGHSSSMVTQNRSSLHVFCSSFLWLTQIIEHYSLKKRRFCFAEKQIKAFFTDNFLYLMPNCNILTFLELDGQIKAKILSQRNLRCSFIMTALLHYFISENFQGFTLTLFNRCCWGITEKIGPFTSKGFLIAVKLWVNKKLLPWP